MNRNDCKYLPFSERELNEKQKDEIKIIVCSTTPHN